MEAVLCVDSLIVAVALALRKREVIPTDLSEFSLAGSGSGEGAFDVLDDGRWLFGCGDRGGMLVESDMAGLEKMGKLIAVLEAVKTAGPADEYVDAQIGGRRQGPAACAAGIATGRWQR